VSTIAEFVEQARARFGNEPRIRAGAWVILLLVLLQIFFMLGDRVRAGAPRIQQLHDQHARLGQVLAAADWQARAEAARARRVAVENRFWSAESEGLARAEFQVWLERIAARTNFEVFGLELRSAIEIEELPGWVRLGATVQGVPDPAAVVRFLGTLADGERVVIVDGVRFGGRNGRSRVDLHAVIRLESG